MEASATSQLKPLSASNTAQLDMLRAYKVTTTNSKHNYPVAPNTLNRQFWAAAPNQKWVGDITYVETREGWL